MPFLFNSGLPVMNSAVTVAVPKQFYCQSRTCQPHWSKPGQANAYEFEPETPHSASVQFKSFNFGNSTSDDEKGIVEKVGDFRTHHVEPNYREMCAVVDCDFLPLERNVSFSFFFFPIIVL